LTVPVVKATLTKPFKRLAARRPVSGREGLTNAERAASELIAQGLNNREVAGRMYVSVNTVAFYMRQTFASSWRSGRVLLAG
jgi:DNA-binding CsgD family transcriptional regulator